MVLIWLYAPVIREYKESLRLQRTVDSVYKCPTKEPNQSTGTKEVNQPNSNSGHGKAATRVPSVSISLSSSDANNTAFITRHLRITGSENCAARTGSDEPAGAAAAGKLGTEESDRKGENIGFDRKGEQHVECASSETYTRCGRSAAAVRKNAIHDEKGIREG